MRLARRLATTFCVTLVLAGTAWGQGPALAPALGNDPGDDPDALAEAALAPPPPVEAPDAMPDSAEAILELFLKGGWLMAPIVLMSVVVLAVACERMLGLRRGRIRPRKLVDTLRRQIDDGDLDPQRAYNACRRSRSALSRVVIAALSKIGRPHAEVEAAAADALQNEADRMYGNVRTLNLAAAVTPLMGLLGTVWGMIESFFVTANAAEGTDKATALAEGIYVALMTTFAGLAVAIPAAVLAHYFEGRILRSLRRVESLITVLLPRIEALEGRGRLDLRQLESNYQHDRTGRRQPAPQVPPTPPAGPPTHHLSQAHETSGRA
ncbi:Biopolymer transport protein ExbB [Posidoniimonas polymericola]|uniref:Biopolymer transport protein ExbB n=1 Tax=Posidoniimonas polymericola TaxID=2528002 RepID=A0A5C5YHF0_9BACT|nr:MotA/TolQ/ExbB proton channel family protein [Posidoniimonas polymericola]TWT72792.1 Biopolymer transport protein ExbB [Posidoniimonas polymericola]